MFLYLSMLLFAFVFLVHSAHSFKLTILHTNDVHCRFEQMDKYNSFCKESDKKKQMCYGGVARRMTKVNEIRKSTPNTILLDAGDQFQGTLWFYKFGGSVVSYFMNKMKYDAMALGNHEFDRGIKGLVSFLQNVSFPVISANIDHSKASVIGSLYTKSIKLNVSNEIIGVVGYTTKQTTFISNSAPLIFLDEVDSVRKEVETLLKNGINKIIALGHAGYAIDKKIAKEVKGVDIVVGGHTNTFLYTGKPPSNEKPEGPYPTVISQEDGTKVLVIQDFAYGKYLGFLQVDFDTTGRLQKWTGNPILLDKSVKQDTKTLKYMKPWRSSIEELYHIVIGKTNVLLEGMNECRLKECNLGNLLTDAMVMRFLGEYTNESWTENAIAIMNSGGIRDTITQGNITVSQLMEVMPFRNTVNIIDITGEDLLLVLEHSIKDYSRETKDGKFLQMSGMKVVYNLSKPNGQRVTEVTIKCTKCIIPQFQPLVKSKVYRVITNDFIINGGDGYRMINEKKKNLLKFEGINNNKKDDILDSDLVHNYMKKYSPLITGNENRIVLRSLANLQQPTFQLLLGALMLRHFAF